MSRMTSTERSSRSDSEVVTCMRLPRSSSSSVSSECVNEEISPKPKVAARPLIDCATRMMVATSSGSGVPMSRRNSASSIWAMASKLSS